MVEDVQRLYGWEVTFEVDQPEPETTNPRTAGLIALLALAPLYFVLVHWAGQNLGFVLFCITFVFAGVVYGYGRLALRWKFAVELAILYFIHIAVILNLHLPDSIPGFVMVPISVADLVVVLLTLALLDRIGKRSA